MNARLLKRTCLLSLTLLLLAWSSCAARNHTAHKNRHDGDSKIAGMNSAQADADDAISDRTKDSSIRLAAADELDQPTEAIIAPEAAMDPTPPAPKLPGSDLPASQAVATLNDVIESVYLSYPLLESAYYSRDIAVGEQISARGEFDLKLKASTESGPVGFYETYRHAIGASQPTWNGGEVFAGYRVGRGTFQPWYLERQTNDGGEFKLGASVPLLRNREIDSRRAGIWRSDYGRQLAEPDIQAQLIGFVQEASYAYWDWVGASQKRDIYHNLLRLADERMERIRRQVEEGFLDPPELTDNRRLVADRKAKLADAERKLQQSAVKLSIFLRDPAGRPIILNEELRPKFPEPEPIREEQLDADLLRAYQNRPELVSLDLQRRQLSIDYAAAENDLLPNLDAVVAGSKDMGLPTSSKGDKSPFELEASLFADVPLQRRKAQGKLTAIEAKMAQLQAKRQLTTNKIVVEVRNAYIALDKAYQQVLETRVAVALAEDLARRESRNEELGLSDMLKVSLREQYAVESAEKQVDAQLQYHKAQADYRAALALDQVE